MRRGDCWIRVANGRHSELAREKMWSRTFLAPILTAETDRDLVRRHFADQAREKELLGNVTSPYNSDRYVMSDLGGPSRCGRGHADGNRWICDRQRANAVAVTYDLHMPLRHAKLLRIRGGEREGKIVGAVHMRCVNNGKILKQKSTGCCRSVRFRDASLPTL